MDQQWLKKQLALHPDKTQVELAKALGLEPPAISKILGGRRQIKAHEYVAMRCFFGLPVEGDRALNPAGGKSAYIIAPLDVAALQEKDTESRDDAWVMPASLFESRTKAPPEKIRIYIVQKDAMVPDLQQGERVLVDLSDTRPSPPGVFVVSDGFGHIIRQCEYLPHSDPPAIKLSARSPKYEPCTIPLAKAQIIGRVLAKLHWL